MAISTKLEMRQGQQLVMTPQLQQAIRLLQFSNLELSQFIAGELERNPLLEIEDGPAETPTPAAEHDASESADGSAEGGDSDEWLDLDKPTAADATDSFDTEYENVYPDGAPSDGPDPNGSQWSQVKQRGSSFDDDEANLEA